MGRAKLDLAAKFQKVGSAQEGTLVRKVEEQKQEIEKLKAKLDQLANSNPADEFALQLAESGGIYAVSIDLIEPNPGQSRKIFPEAELHAFGINLQEEGQLIPIILIPQENGKYLIFDGEFRWRSARFIGWEEIKAVFANNLQLDHHKLRRQTLSSTIHRFGLHELDLAESLIEEIVYQYPELDSGTDTANHIATTLKSIINRLSKNKNNGELAEVKSKPRRQQDQWLDQQNLALEESNLLRVILGLQLNPSSVCSNIFPILKLSDDLKSLVRETGIEGQKAIAINRLTASNLNVSEQEAARLRKEMVNETLSKRLSVKKVKDRIQELLNQNAAPNPKKSMVLQKYINTISSIQELPIQEFDQGKLEELKLTLQSKLQEIEAVLAQQV